MSPGAGSSPAAGRPLSLPAVVATVGLHGSASTWVFNIARELMAARDPALLTFYADRLDLFPPEMAAPGRHVVFKSHHGSEALDAWLAERRVPILLSLRDPRDAALSMAQRFRASLAHTAQWLAADCQRFARLAALGHPIFRFEDRFFDRPETIARIAERLGLECDAETSRILFARYRTEAVRAFAQELETLPPERLTHVGTHRMDRVTQILGPHIGDAGSGKWRRLPPPVAAELTRVFRPFLDRFGYAA